MKRTIAVFDFDGTVTKRDTLLPFLIHVKGLTSILLGLGQLTPTMVSFIMGRMNNHSAKEKVFKYFFAGMREEDIESMAKSFAYENLPRMLQPKALSCIMWHHKQGHNIIINSASLELCLNAWGKICSVDYVIGTKLEVDAGIVTGRIDGKNCYGEEKVNRLKPILSVLQADEIYAYGNGRGDKELLEMADHSFYKTWPNVY